MRNFRDDKIWLMLDEELTELTAGVEENCRVTVEVAFSRNPFVEAEQTVVHDAASTRGTPAGLGSDVENEGL